ncbi:thioredoxin domain-containing protein [Phaeovibrio sulfidiphilus]|uniref:Thioredoxin domain-containing protein n=1 Tax=Phaeovibrio sulfidiphilus TaxID=1220600 RepID=A0A8J7CDZ5_9PROT|nr:thioredoxin domain-containing protein [Phaeovibrio sulfidiphilus]
MKIRLSLLILCVLSAVGFGLLSGPARAEAPSAADSAKFPEHVIGRADAPVTVVEYSSILCNHCATFHKDVLPEIRKAYIDTGLVRWVFRDHSLGNPWAMVGAMVLRCAPADMDYALRNSLMENAATWYGATNPLGALKGLVALAGMSPEAVDACVGNPAVLDSIRAGEQEATRLGINSTPSFVISGIDKPLIGFQSFDKFKKALDPLLKKK